MESQEMKWRTAGASLQKLGDQILRPWILEHDGFYLHSSEALLTSPNPSCSSCLYLTKHSMEDVHQLLSLKVLFIQALIETDTSLAFHSKFPWERIWLSDWPKLASGVHSLSSHLWPWERNHRTNPEDGGSFQKRLMLVKLYLAHLAIRCNRAFYFIFLLLSARP